MPIKAIFVPLTDSESAAATLGAAFNLAKTFGGHVSTVHLRSDPSHALGDFTGETISPVLVEQVITDSETRSKETAAKARKAFDAAVKKAGAVTTKRAPKDALSASYDEVTGFSDDAIEERGRVSDLIVVRRARDAQDANARIVGEAALMGTGRAVLFVPPRAPAKIGSNVAIAWNGSREAARAVDAAMPFLERATSVTVISATESGSDVDQKGILEYLSRHGIKNKGMKIKAGSDTGKAIVNAAGRAKANLLVMGAYTHSRVRELMFGGVTEHALENAKLPVLMVH